MALPTSSRGRSDRLSYDVTIRTTTSDDDSVKLHKKKKSIIPKIFSPKEKDGCKSAEDLLDRRIHFSDRRFMTGGPSLLDSPPAVTKSFSDRHTSTRIESLNLCTLERPKDQIVQVQEYRIFVATWNVGGRSPNKSLNLADFLQVEGSSDIYVLGFQETVPLNAGNVLVIEDSEPAAKWLSQISQALNKPEEHKHRDDPSVCHTSRQHYPKDYKSASGVLFFQKPSLKVLSRNYRVDSSLIKVCNCESDVFSKRHRMMEMRDFLYQSDSDSDDYSSSVPSPQKRLKYCLISSKQMVGIFLSVWVRSELVPHVGHLRTSTMGRGIMGCFGNKGCIAISMSVHRTSFCFVCSHLASGEKEGDEVRRNSDVAEIIKSTHFPRICKTRIYRIPEGILEHDRVIWLGDLNYRIALSYDEARTLLEDNNWDALFQKDQLRIEREAGRVFQRWKEGKIHFAPTYKYSNNSDCYAGETTKSKKKRRTPAWCDRILWYGKGIEQLSYVRGESRFSDHRPVCAVFAVEVELQSGNKKGCSSFSSRKEFSDCLPPKEMFYEF